MKLPEIEENPLNEELEGLIEIYFNHAMKKLEENLYET